MGAESRDRFAEVVRAPEVRVDLALLLIAADALPPDRGGGVALDRYLDAGLAALDDLAAAVPRDGRDDVRLRSVLGGFGGDAEDYGRLESSLLPEVLRRRRGLPILLSCVWTETARRCGIAAHGVGLPGHFVVGLGPPGFATPGDVPGPAMPGDVPGVLVDPFDGGRLLPYDRARDLVERSGSVFRREHLRPASATDTLSRVLANIRAWAEGPERASVRLWSTELGLLLPHHDVALRRERAAARLVLGDYLDAARGFDEYADTVAAVDPREADDARRLARRARSHLN